MYIEPYVGHPMYCAWIRGEPAVWSIAQTREMVKNLLERERFTVNGQPRVAGLELGIHLVEVQVVRSNRHELVRGSNE